MDAPRAFPDHGDDYLVDMIRQHLQGQDEALLFGKGPSLSDWSPDQKWPSLRIAVNEACLMAPNSWMVCYDKTPLFNVDKALGGSASTLRVIVADRIAVEHRHLVEHFHPDSGWFSRYKHGAVASTPNVIIRILGWAGVKRVLMVGFDQLFDPERNREHEAISRGDYDPVLRNIVRSSGGNMSNRSWDYTLVNNAIRDSAEETGVELVKV